MSFRRRPMTIDEQVADLYEQIRQLRGGRGGGMGGTLTLGAVIVDGTVAGVELVEPDEDTMGTAAVTLTASPTIGRIPVLSGDVVVGWLAVFDV